ncbi:MAG: hypothetical protein U0793_05905 [Gemmataceae bacterium]
MNLSSRIHELKRRKRQGADGLAPSADAGPPARRFRWALVACVVVSAVATFFVVDRFFLARADVVGLWGVDGGEQDGATLELLADGSFHANVNDRGKNVPVQGRYRVEGKKLTFYTLNPTTEKEEPLRKTIEQLGAEEMWLREASGKSMKLVRLKEENRP